jgi:adenosylcobinamide-phosphate synthase
MRLEYQIIIAFALDAILGDPQWMPHPVRMIGKFAAGLERPLRSLFRNAFLAGLLLWSIVFMAVGLIAAALLFAAYRIHPSAGDIIGIILLYFGFAGRDLLDHGSRVYRALVAGNLREARRRVSMMVGRDTAGLDQKGIARAAVESIAENLVDGVTAPVFYAILAGPVGLWLYKAINTLDSMFGHKDERYLYFGRASAKIDDVANYLPARLTALLVPVAAFLTGGSPRHSFRILQRDGRKHASPNAGLSEAAFAGALGVPLGGMNYYDGKAEYAPTMGEEKEILAAHHIRRAIRMMALTALLFLMLLVVIRILLCQKL